MVFKAEHILVRNTEGSKQVVRNKMRKIISW